MTLTRREFALASTSLLALTVVGCEQPPPPSPDKPKPPVPTEPFTVGSPGGYRSAGLYDKFGPEKRVWLVSDGKTLVAFADLCTHSGCSLNAAGQTLTCPCHASTFDLTGSPVGNARAKRPLERFAISIVQSPRGAEVQIDPTKRFVKDKDKDQWSDPLASLTLPA